MDRRALLLGSGLWALGSAVMGEPSAPALSALARQGGVLLIRHASTEAGLGDPPGFALGQCNTQRNLSQAGRAEARAIGAWFRQHQLPVQAVFSSQWCRCQDTARLAFGRYQDWPALNSTFAGQGQHERQLQLLRERLRQLPAGQLEVWVTHQVIMSGLTGAYPAMGEGFLVDEQGLLRARGMMRPDA
jgi:phosphohistidine phosphatase SixA